MYIYTKTIDYCINYTYTLYLKVSLYITLLETVKRKCPCCHKAMEFDNYEVEYQPCIICLEKARARYQEHRETISRQCNTYRDENVDKEQQRHKLYNLQTREMINAKKEIHIDIVSIIVLCVYIIIKYIEKRSLYIFITTKQS